MFSAVPWTSVSLSQYFNDFKSMEFFALPEAITPLESAFVFFELVIFAVPLFMTLLTVVVLEPTIPPT